MKVMATWNHGVAANERALQVIKQGGSAMDAVVEGCMVTELDERQRSVGLSGWPDSDGRVSLDAAVMSDDSRAGSVACVRGVANPVQLARRVMDHTPHVMLVGEGAERFAQQQGMLVRDRALDHEQRARLDAWLQQAIRTPLVNVENHDTISMIALDASGRMAVASTTSGLAFKIPGRVGDSPIIGAGLFVERGVGAAVCTGLGEVVQRTMGAYAMVESMRQGLSPQAACEAFIRRLHVQIPESAECQVGVLAMDYGGRAGALSVQSGFTYAVGTAEDNTLHESAFTQDIKQDSPRNRS